MIGGGVGQKLTPQPLGANSIAVLKILSADGGDIHTRDIALRARMTCTQASYAARVLQGHKLSVRVRWGVWRVAR